MWDFKTLCSSLWQSFIDCSLSLPTQPSTESQAVSSLHPGSCRGAQPAPAAALRLRVPPLRRRPAAGDRHRQASRAAARAAQRDPREARATVRDAAGAQLRPAGGSCQRLRAAAGRRAPGEVRRAARYREPGARQPPTSL